MAAPAIQLTAGQTPYDGTPVGREGHRITYGVIDPGGTDDWRYTVSLSGDNSGSFGSLPPGKSVQVFNLVNASLEKSDYADIHAVTTHVQRVVDLVYDFVIPAP